MALTQREAFARLMEHMVQHDGHGYSQYTRMGNGRMESVNLGDGVVVDIAGGDRDCSSAIITALRAVGIDTYGATYTGNMRGELMKTGLFEWWPVGIAGKEAQRGDIYLNEHKHTAMCTSAVPDMLAHFSISENGTIHGVEGDQTGREACIRSYYDYPWHGKLHWKSDGAMLGEKPKPKVTIPDVKNGVYRLYSAGHFYTMSRGEAQTLCDKGWTYEGVAFKAPDTGIDVFRVYNPSNGYHHYTTSHIERDMLVRNGWKDEGVAWQCNNTGIEVYRSYNPNDGDHLLTTSLEEVNSTVKSGWLLEGVAFRV